MVAMGLTDLANYYWLGERVCLRVIKAWQVRHVEAQKAASAQSDECAGRRVRETRDCRPIGFGPQFIVEPWLRKCIGRFAKHGYSENRRLVRSERLYAKSIAVNEKWRVSRGRGII